eukprot:TRINITY_DN62705_c0_g1_i1.p1 TRINITY_DN62705_c0_g1~~TRINITY_DN62705_c0_g1_i1.p1  ORF type:complete len:701 (-),score=180.71 TRINITY_DN62705_c0_g1_i1:53-2155(-)
MNRYLTAAACLGTVGYASAEEIRATPVAKVIDLLGRLQAKVEEEGKAEAVEYDRFACFCKDQADTKQYHIEKSDKRLETLSATITALEADIAELGEDITQLTTDIDSAETEHGKEVSASSAAHDTYVSNAKEMTDAIAAIEGAIDSLKASKQQLKGNAKLDLAQLRTVAVSHLSGEQLRAVGGFISSQDPAAYTYSSNDIIATLEGLKKTFTQNKKELDETEFARASTSDKKLLGLANTKKFKTKTKAEKEALVGSKTEKKHEAEAEQTAETSARDADKEFQGELTTLCQERASEFDSRSKARSAEITAMQEAISSLKSGVAPNYGANKKLVGLVKTSVQPHTVTPKHSPNVAPSHKAMPKHSFLQLRHRGGESDIAQRALDRLDKEAARLHSSVLSAVAAKVRLQEDHFAKVRQLIKDLVARLESEASSEADQKSYCDTEMGKAVSARDAQQLEKEQQSSIVSGKKAEKDQLMQDIAALSQEIADLNKGLNEATQLRSEEKSDNEKTIADAGAGKVAVEDAIRILQTYYESQGDAALLQAGYTPPNADREGKTVADRAPEMSYSGDYRGAQDASKGIIGLLQVIQSDFERTESTVRQAETDAVEKFQKFETDTQADIGAKEGEKSTKEKAVTDAEDAITTAIDALNDATGLHEGAQKELEQLKAMCVDGEESYAERKAQREKEIDALKQALTILDEWKN